MPASFKFGVVPITNPGRTFRVDSRVEAFRGNGTVIVAGGNTPIARLHGSYARKGIGPAELGVAVGRHLLDAVGIGPHEVLDMAIASSVPDVSHTFLPTTVRTRLGLKSVVNPRHVASLCTGGASAIATSIQSLEFRGDGIAMALGADDQSLGQIMMDNRFRAILAEVTGRELPMRFDLDPKGPKDNAIRPEQFLEAVRLFMESHGSLQGIVTDGILTSFHDTSSAEYMWDTAARVADAFDVGDEEAGQIALRSHRSFWTAADRGFFDGIVAAVSGSNLTRDENPMRDASLRRLLRGKTARGVHSGTSSQMGGGASGVLLTSTQQARERGLPVLAEIVGYSFSEVDPQVMGLGPISATKGLLDFLGLPLACMGHIEINEAFAAIVSAFLKFPDFGFGYNGSIATFPDRVNPWGGAIAKGHVMGSKFLEMVNLGVRFFELNPDEEYCLATLCGGGGQGAAIVLRNPHRIPSITPPKPRHVVTEGQHPLVRALVERGYLAVEQTVRAVEEALAEGRRYLRPIPIEEDLDFVLRRVGGRSLPAIDLLRQATSVGAIRTQGHAGSSETIGPILGVIGAGEMGHQIALDYARAGYEVHMSDVDWERANTGRERIVGILADGVQRGLYTPEESARILARIHLSGNMVETVKSLQTGGRKFEMIIEAAVEELERKRPIFEGLRSVVNSGTILATNTSSLTAGEVGADCIYHYGNPVHGRFVIDGTFREDLDPQKRCNFESRLRAIARNTRKAYYVAKKDAPGALYNPIFVAAYTTSTRLLPEVEERIRATAGAELDRTTDPVRRTTLGQIKERPRDFAIGLLERLYADELGLNLRRDGMGAFRLIDATGGPKVAFECAVNVAAYYGEFYQPPEALRRQFVDWSRKENPDKWNWVPTSNQQEYADLVDERSRILQEVLGRDFLNDTRADFQGQLWGSVLNMTGLMHDKGVIDDPTTLDNAVEIGVMYAHPPEAKMREHQHLALIDKMIRDTGQIPADFFTNPIPMTDLPRVQAATLEHELDGKIARVTINRPRVRNAIDTGVLEDLQRIAGSVAEDTNVSLVVFGGEGGRFVSGADIRWFADRQRRADELRTAGNEAGAIAELARIHDDFSRIEVDSMKKLNDPKRLTVALVEGDTVGGGVEMAAQADIVLFLEGPEGERGTCYMPEASLGIGIGYGAHLNLVNKVKTAHAKRILLTGAGATFGASDAVHMGFANAVVRRDQLNQLLQGLTEAWEARPDGQSKEEFLRGWNGQSSSQSARLSDRARDRLDALEKLWSDEENVRVMAMGYLPPWLEGSEKELAEKEVAAIRRGSPEAIALLNRMVDEGEKFGLRTGLIQVFDTSNARAAIGAFADRRRGPTFRWPHRRKEVLAIAREREARLAAAASSA